MNIYSLGLTDGAGGFAWDQGYLGDAATKEGPELMTPTQALAKLTEDEATKTCPPCKCPPASLSFESIKNSWKSLSTFKKVLIIGGAILLIKRLTK